MQQTQIWTLTGPHRQAQQVGSKWMEKIIPDKQELKKTVIARLILDKIYYKAEDILDIII